MIRLRGSDAGGFAGVGSYRHRAAVYRRKSAPAVLRGESCVVEACQQVALSRCARRRRARERESDAPARRHRSGELVV